MSADTFNTLWGGEYFKLTKSEPISELDMSFKKPNISYILNPEEIKNFRLMPIEWGYFVHDDTLYLVTAVSYMSWGVVTARMVDFTSWKHWEESKFSMDDIKGKTISVSEAYDMIIGQLWTVLRANNVLSLDDPMGFPPSKSYLRQCDNRRIRKPEWMWVDDSGQPIESWLLPEKIEIHPADDTRSYFSKKPTNKIIDMKLWLDYRFPTRKDFRDE